MCLNTYLNIYFTIYLKGKRKKNNKSAHGFAVKQIKAIYVRRFQGEFQ